MEVDPFRHCVIDGFVSRELCRAASVEWPDARWPHWHRYEGREGTKFSTKDASRLPPACAEIVRQILGLRLSTILGIDGTFPDFTLHGAGMHMIPQGGRLPLHLDGDHHPLTGWGRAASCVLWIDEWLPVWGGQLRLWGGNAAEPSVAIDPAPGRLAIFECSDASWHDVAAVATDASYPRRSLAAFFWSQTAKKTLRPRAEFV